MLRKAICMMGEDAARIFYDGERFTRNGSMPQASLRLLQDQGSVQQKDGEDHQIRKQMFLSLMTPAAVQAMGSIMSEELRAASIRWQKKSKVVLFDELQDVICRAACRWAGIPISNKDASSRAREFGAMMDGAGSFGWKSMRGLMLRSKSERWAQGIIKNVRSGMHQIGESSPVQVIAFHRDLKGELLERKTAAVELINILRPTVAVARFVVFAAHALHKHPECRPKLVESDEYKELFVQEIRRHYPFFPFVGARVKKEFSWRNHFFTVGEWVLLDLYGTNHDERIWTDPNVFRPERFLNWKGSAYNFIPQGAGKLESGHRCPGEGITKEVMKAALQFLTEDITYRVPPQDLRINLVRMPAIPESRFIIDQVQPKA